MTEDEKLEKIRQFRKMTDEMIEGDFSDDPWDHEAIRQVAEIVLERIRRDEK